MNAPPADHSVRFVLRQATAADHARLDSAVSPLLEGNEEQYLTFLRGSAKAVFGLEIALEAFGIVQFLPDWPLRARRPALTQDLAVFGEMPPPAGAVLHVPSEPFAFGILYVLEGSRLGGAVLSERLGRHPSPKVRAAHTYLRHGAAEGFWRTFLTRFEAASVCWRDTENAITGARHAFACFRAELSPADGKRTCSSPGDLIT